MTANLGCESMDFVLLKKTLLNFAQYSGEALGIEP
jgi:hypothetical protein